MIAYVVERVRKSRLVSEVWLATTTNPEDSALVEWAAGAGLPCFRGSADDVLDRYYRAARAAQAEVVVRITGDCPLIDPAVIDQVVQAYLQDSFDYVSNTQPPTFPDGLDIEVFSFTALERAWREARLGSEREHVTPYLWKHPEIFKLKNVAHVPDLSVERWTLDTAADFEFLTRVIEGGAPTGGPGSLPEVLAMVAAHPEWRAINVHQRRNAGYQKSLCEDTAAFS